VPVPARRPSPPALTRRTAVAGVLAGLAGMCVVTACDGNRGDDGTGPGVSDGSGTPAADPDAALVTRVDDQLVELLTLVEALGARFGGLHARLRPWRDLHRAHLDVLDTATSPGPSSPAPDLAGVDSPTAALRVLASHERLAHARLVDASVAARSGALARLLASMAAAVAQRLTLLDGALGGTT